MRNLTSLFSAFLMGIFFFFGTAYASWAYMFVVNDGNMYVITQEQVDPNQIGSKVGEVTKYSDMEGTYSSNFSNRYPKGTKYYEINGVDVKEAIAVQESEPTGHYWLNLRLGI